MAVMSRGWDLDKQPQPNDDVDDDAMQCNPIQLHTWWIVSSLNRGDGPFHDLQFLSECDVDGDGTSSQPLVDFCIRLRVPHRALWLVRRGATMSLYGVKTHRCLLLPLLDLLSLFLDPVEHSFRLIVISNTVRSDESENLQITSAARPL